MPAIVTQQLTKAFGDVLAVDHLDLTVEEGEVFGFLGPNGSGKSTTIRLLLDELRPTSGSARLFGLDSHVDAVAVHAQVGYLPGDLVLPADMSGDDYLDFLTSLRGGHDRRFRDELVDRFELDPTRRIGHLSTGNRQKVGLIQAFMHRPALVLLDEPMTGLDPLVQHNFHQLLEDVAGNGMTVLLSTHRLSEVNRVADRVGILRSGCLVTIETVSMLRARTLSHVDLEFADPPDVHRLESADGVRSIAVRDNVASITVEGSIDSVLRRAIETGTVLSLRAPESDLEQAFLDHYREPLVLL